MDFLKMDANSFCEEAAPSLKAFLGPLRGLDPRERFIFVEYHYYRTHMRTLAEALKISLGRTYEILYRAEERISASRA